VVTPSAAKRARVVGSGDGARAAVDDDVMDDAMMDASDSGAEGGATELVEEEEADNPFLGVLKVAK
jgi:hypothetical protein